VCSSVPCELLRPIMLAEVGESLGRQRSAQRTSLRAPTSIVRRSPTDLQGRPPRYPRNGLDFAPRLRRNVSRGARSTPILSPTDKTSQIRAPARTPTRWRRYLVLCTEVSLRERAECISMAAVCVSKTRSMVDCLQTGLRLSLASLSPRWYREPRMNVFSKIITLETPTP